MTTDKEVVPEFRDESEVKIKDIIIWALGEAAVTEMTKTVRDNDPNKMNINQLYALFRLHFIPERNNIHSRVDFFGNRTKLLRTSGEGSYKGRKTASSIK